jgi:hypothetical protein
MLDADNPRIRVHFEQDAEREGKEDSIIAFPRFARTKWIVLERLVDGMSGLGNLGPSGGIRLHPSACQLVDSEWYPLDLVHHSCSR